MRRFPAIAALVGIVAVSLVFSGMKIGCVTDMNPLNGIANSSTASAATGVRVIGYGYAPATVVTETCTFTSIYSYTVTSSSTTYTTTTTTTTATQTIVTIHTLSTTTTTTATSTFWYTQTSTQTTSRTSVSIVPLTSLTTATLTNTSTSLYPTVTVTSMNASYKSITTFSPTVTATFVQTSVIPIASTVTLVRAATTTTTTTLTIVRPCVIASAAYGSELAPQVQFLREFRDSTVMSTFAGAQFMRVFNAFYYSFSPVVAEAMAADPTTGSLVRTSISPLIKSLSLASRMFRLLPMNPELATLLTGIVASGLIGVIYVTPFAVSWAIRKKLRTAGDQ